MLNYKVIENSLIPVYQTEKGNNIVDARELHEFLKVGKDFSNWIKDRIKKYKFVENEDYCTLTKNGEYETVGFKGKIDYVLKMDTAKEIAMVENNERGREVRKYFIEIEKKYQTQNNTQQYNIPKTLSEALRLAADLEEERLKLIPKAESFDSFISCEGLNNWNITAKALKWGRNKMLQHLRDLKIIDEKNIPYQRYMDTGYFEIKFTPIKNKSFEKNHRQAYVTPKGITWLDKILNKANLKQIAQ